MLAPTSSRPGLAWVAGLVLLAASGAAVADPPSRVARLGYASGTVSFSPAGEEDWVRATVNRPMGTGDRLWSQPGGRAEVQVGGAMLRMSADTALSVLNLDDQITQLQLTQGVLIVRVRRLESDQAFEVDTPNLAFTLRQPGVYRIEVDPGRDTTTIHVRSGQGEAYGEDAAYLVDARQSYRFYGSGLRDYELVDRRGDDDFDRWTSDRDRRYDGSISARYVSSDVIGYQDLDTNGRWRVDATYGNVWIPNNVSADWAPYQNGHWAWVDPWGWTWIDDAPWGFAVSHYGRWAHLGGSWGWVPGPPRTRAYYAPALVVFIGGDNFQLRVSSGNVGGVGWFPLAPREIYRPAYPVSRGYFENLNRSNTVIQNTTVINNYYDNSTTINKTVYVNRQVPGAVVAVPATAFVQSQPVARAAVRVAPDRQVAAAVVATAAVAPTRTSVRGAAVEVEKPPATVFERRVVARSEPPAARGGFDAQERQLKAQPGKPLDDEARRELKPKATAPAPVVKLIERRPDPSQARSDAPEGRAGRPAAADRPSAAVPPPSRPASGADAQGAAEPSAAPPYRRDGERPTRPPPRERNAARDDESQRGRPATPSPGLAQPAPDAGTPPSNGDRPPASRPPELRRGEPRPPAGAASVPARPASGSDSQGAADPAIATPRGEGERPTRFPPRERNAARDDESQRGRPTTRPPPPPPGLVRPAPDAGAAPSNGDRPPLNRPPEGRRGEPRPPAGAASMPSPAASAASAVPPDRPGSAGERGRADDAPRGPR